MLVDLLEAIVRRLAAVWRIFGSPRIAGDEKAVASAKSAWTKRGQLTLRRTSLTARTRNAIIGTGGIVAVVVFIWLIMSLFGGGDEETTVVEGFPTPIPFTGPEFMTEVQALSLALAGARDAGLVSQNFDHIARRIQFGEYAQAIGELDRAQRGLLETPSDTEIWAFAFAGDVELEIDTGERVEYDNLTVVLDAITGKIYRAEAFYGEYESEARAPVWLRPPTPTPAPTEVP